MKGEINSLPAQSEPALGVEKKNSATGIVIFICWFVIFAEGYDLGIYGAVIPALMKSDWGLTATQAGLIGSYALAGVLVGTILIGAISDIIGRKYTLISCLILFSLSMVLSAMASSPEMFALYRFIGGLGIGGVGPCVSALTIEYSAPNRRSFNYTLMNTGYALGGVSGAIVALFLLNDQNWRILFWIGVLPLLTIPIIIKYLPESVSFLMIRGRRGEAERIANRFDISLDSLPEVESKEIKATHSFSALKSLLIKENAVALILFSLTYFMTFLMVYGLNTWLPKIMQQAGYPIKSSFLFLLIFNLTAVIGSLLAGAAADRWGSNRVISISYLLGGISILLLTVTSNEIVLHALVGIAGFGALGTTSILTAYVSKYFITENRSSALGFVIGFGRFGAICGPILGGILLSNNISLSWSFYVFAFAALLAALCSFLVPRKRNQQSNI